MGRPKGSKNKSKKSKHDPVKLAAILGISVEEAAAKIEETATPERMQNEAEATIAYAYDVGDWLDKKCKNCNRPFATNYKYVAFCSMKCRKQDLEAIGIQWDPSKTEEQRWEGLGVQVPGVVPPAAILALQNLARKFAAATPDDEISQPEIPSHTNPTPQIVPDKPPANLKVGATVVFR
jgi:hypothetical protein